MPGIFARGLMARMGVGAAAGGVAGALGDFGDYGGIAGGTLGGALGGALLGPAARRVGAFAGNRGVKSIAGGLGMAANKGASLGGSMMDYGAGQIMGGAGYGGLGSAAILGGGYLQAGARQANALIGRNYMAVNKWGGRGLAAMGVGSAAYIGNSVLGSNRSGYRY